MYSAAFIFRPGEYDDEFHRLNKLIGDAANETDGFVGTESWTSTSGDILNATYYWASLEALKMFSRHSKHLQAKKQYRRWYDGYHIVISEVIRSYGDNTIEHFTSGERT